MPRVRRYMSIRTKMILMVAVTLVLANVATAILTRRLVFENIVSQKLTTVDILTSSLVHDVKYQLEMRDSEDVQEIVAKYMTYYRIIRRISYYDRDLVNRADSDPARLGESARDPKVVEAIRTAKPSVFVTHPDWENFGIQSVAPLLQGSRIVGAVAIDVSIQDIQLTLSAIDHRILLIQFSKVLLVCVALYFLLRGTILQRLERLMTVTHQIAAGNYDIQVLDSRSDEIGALSQSFDRMSSDLMKSKQEIEGYNKHLEERVRDGTAELQKAYEDLKNTQSQLVLNEKMASLGVLIAGVAHEINTPVGAILNVSRNLERRIETLPRTLESFKREADLPTEKMVTCLEALIAASGQTNGPLSYKQTRAIETLLRANGIEDPSASAAALAKLNFGDEEKIREHLDCFRVPSFFAFAESFGSIMQAARISETSSQKIMEIVRALKYYAYSDKDKVELIQINESIQIALVLLRNLLKESVIITTDFDPDLSKIPCTSEIHQVWTNLLTNACDAIDALQDGTQGQIGITTRLSGEQILVTVTDNGAGIPPAMIDKVFDPFFTTKDIGKGTGLGLCIVSGIIKKLGGAVRVRSRRGETVFEIALPVAGRDPQDGDSAGVLDAVIAEPQRVPPAPDSLEERHVR